MMALNKIMILMKEGVSQKKKGKTERVSQKKNRKTERVSQKIKEKRKS